MDFKMPDKLEAKPKKTKAPKASEWYFVNEGDKPSADQPKSFAQVRAKRISLTT